MIKTWLSDDYHAGPSRQNKKISIQWDFGFFKDVLFRRSTRQSFRNLFTTQACSHCVEAHSVAIAIHFNSSASICLEPLVIDPVGHVVNSTSLRLLEQETGLLRCKPEIYLSVSTFHDFHIFRNWKSETPLLLQRHCSSYPFSCAATSCSNYRKMTINKYRCSS